MLIRESVFALRSYARYYFFVALTPFRTLNMCFQKDKTIRSNW